MGILTEYAAFPLRYHGRGPRTLSGCLFFALTVGAIALAKSDDLLAKVFENELLRGFLKILLCITAIICMVAMVAAELKAA